MEIVFTNQQKLNLKEIKKRYDKLLIESFQFLEQAQSNNGHQKFKACAGAMIKHNEANKQMIALDDERTKFYHEALMMSNV